MDVIPPSPYERLSYLRNDINRRIETFQNWPRNAPVSIQDLVNDGFYYTGLEDKVQCTHCGGVLSGWTPGDVVYMEHERHFPQCPLVMSRQQQQYQQQILPPPQCFPTQPVGPPNVNSDSFNFSHTAQTGENFNMRYYETNNAADNPGLNRPKYAEFATVHSRLNTFKAWPSQITQRPEQLVDSGFFYMGQGDKVKCFFCGGILWDWEAGDDVYEEHAKWFPLCPWLRLQKGQDYIDRVQRILKGEENPSPESQAPGASQQPAPAQQNTVTVVARPSDDMAGASLCISDVTTMMGRTHLGDYEELVTGTEETHVKTIDDEEEQSAPNNIAVTQTEATPTPYRQMPILEISDYPSSSPITGGAGQNDLSKIDVRRIMEENKNLKEEKLCKICMDSQVNVVFIPCGHMVCCTTCAVSVYDCPICRKQIRDRVRTYW